MAHEYEVETHGQGTHTVTVPDEHHHTNWKDTAVFIGMIASMLAVSKEVIKGVKYMRKV